MRMSAVALATLLSLTAAAALADASENDPADIRAQITPNLKLGAPLQIQVDETSRTYPAKVVRLGAKVDPVSHSVKITGELSGYNPELTAGMSGRVLLSIPGE